jgi:hypothetical protein
VGTSNDATIGMAIVVTLLIGLVMVGVWVYRDARAHALRGRPITGSLGSFELTTPLAWLAACVLLPEVALVAYLDRRVA